MALMFGELKKANPVPRKTRLAIITDVGVVGCSRLKTRTPITVIVIPAEARKRGSIRSDILPAIGEIKAIMTGCAMRTVPAAGADMPLIYCRYRLTRKVTPKVAE